MDTVSKIRFELARKADKALANARLFDNFPDTFATTCWASDSNKPVWSCWCAQCHELVDTVRETGELPEFAIAQ